MIHFIRNNPRFLTSTLLVLCLAAGLLAPVVSARNAASLNEESAAEWVEQYGEMKGQELIDTAANKIEGHVESLHALFAQLQQLEQLYDRQGRSGEEPSPVTSHYEGHHMGGAIAIQEIAHMIEEEHYPGGYTPESRPAPGKATEEMGEVISLIHLGDSHIQGGFLTRQVRRRMQYRFGNAGRGLLTPYKLMKTNQPWDYELSSPQSWVGTRCVELNPLRGVGLTGTAIATEERSVEFTIVTPGEPFESITIFHHAEAPLLKAGEEPSEISCPWNDTPTRTYIPLGRQTERITLRGDLSTPGYTTPVFYGFSVENGRSGILYHSVGINGNYFGATAKNSEILEGAAQLNPQLIILSMGTNDAYGQNFELESILSQLRRIIAQCRQSIPQSALLLTTPMECYVRVGAGRRAVLKVNPNCAAVREGIIRVAKEEGVPYWDFYAAAGAEGAMERWNEIDLGQRDKIHLTGDGYRLQGEMFYQALMKAYTKFKRQPA